jgi:ATP-dependent Clp protease ATP-binding subunit ClpC
MFQRFTDAARRVVVSAQEQARELRHDYIGTEHLLLGLYARRADDQALIAALPPLTVAMARERVATVAPAGEQSPANHIPFNQQAKKVLELSLRAAMASGHSTIEPGHLLLALLDVPDSAGLRVLVELGLDPERLRDTVTGTLGIAQPVPDRVTALEEQVRLLTEQVADLRRRLDAPDQHHDG